MKAHHVLVGLVPAAALVGLFVMSAAAPGLPRRATTPEGPAGTGSWDARGRYVAMIGGCNDCHTRGFTQALSQVPESAWLEGDATGWWGPWGTTYAANLRLLIPPMSQETWVKFARELKTRPPMPWWVLHEMNEADLLALHRFIKALGPTGEPMPAALPPGAKPGAPYVAFVFEGASTTP